MIETRQISVGVAQTAQRYDIHVGGNLLCGLGEFARTRIDANARRVVIISNRKVFALYGAAAEKSLIDSGLHAAAFLMPDGERYKNLRVLENALRFFSAQKLTRSDAVVALGGGVVGDLAGFAAAIFQRGVPFIQVPTTFLSQIDSSVGGKTAVNTDFGKNMIGAFYQPRGVLIDVETLKTLPRREVIAGFCEAVKHGAIGDRKLFDETRNFLTEFPLKNFRRFYDAGERNFRARLQTLISANIEFKARVVAGDERESVSRDDAGSRKILNFGHTVAHALEKITHYKRFKHGEAVGLGMLAAAKISQRLGKLSQHELNLFSDVLHSVGRLPTAADIKPEIVSAAFAHDKKAAGDSFKWILLENIGRAAVIDNRIIPTNIVRDAVSDALCNKF